MKHQSLESKAVWQLCKSCGLYIGLACLIIAVNISWAFLRTNGEGWKTYRHDNARSGVTIVSLTTPLSLRWTFKPTHAPKPAWPEPAEEPERMHLDNAYHVTASKGMVYFGSSVDNKVYALNAKTGEVHWTFFTEGPVRYAPTVWKDRIYVGSDDGYVYCLRAKNGRLIWKYRAGPSDEKVLGNGRMISLWPVRTSVLVDDGIVYFGAGVFPYEGIYICALNADAGTIIWKNDTIGDRAHELNFGGISPQSYLLASKEILFVPSGRAMPAAFDKKSGQFLYYCRQREKLGGSWALLDKGNLVAGVDKAGTPAKVSYEEKTGKIKDSVHTWFQGIDLVVTPGFSYTLTKNGIYAIDRAEYMIMRNKLNSIGEELQKLGSRLSDLRRKLRDADDETIFDKQRDDILQKISDLAEKEERLKDSTYKWEYLNKNLSSLILVGKVVFAGGKGIVVAVDTETGKELWKTEVEGKACGLAATNGNLFVSTDNGNIYCLGEGRVSQAKEIKPTITLSPYRKDKLSLIYESAAEAIVRETAIKKGYCLVLGSNTGRLAFEIANRTELKIIGIEKDPKKAAVAKKRLDEAGLYGSRIVVEQWDLSTLPDYYANLIVSDEIMISGKIEFSSEDMFRVLNPYGGVAYFGQPLEVLNVMKSVDLQNLLEWLRTSGTPEPDVVQENGVWAKVTRGKLEGAGSWTQQYGNPQNTACSGEELVKGQLGTLWFGEPGPKGILERHAKATSPVSINGRLFVQGEEIIMAYDAYNGTLLWEREIPGAVRVRADLDCGNLSVTENGLYVAAHDKCYRLDLATGETVRVFEIPSSPDGSSQRWGYVSCTGNILYGSTATPLKEEYAALWKNLVENGKWKSIDEIPPQYRIEYENYVSRYPVPDEKLQADFQRSGALWRSMADFPKGGEFTVKGAVTENIQVASDKIFAIKPETGKLLWVHNGNRIANITISIGGGKIFFAESAVTEEQKRRAFEYKREIVRTGIYKEMERRIRDSRAVRKELDVLMKEKNPFLTRNINDLKAELSIREIDGYDYEVEGEAIEYDDADVRLVVALDAVTGKKLWEKPIDLTGCCGDTMGSAYHNSMLFFFGNLGNHDAWRFNAGTMKWRRITALSNKNGDVLWSRPLNYRTRPVIVGDKIIIEPRACDLRTGETVMRSHPVTGNEVPWEFLRPGHTCAITAASADGLFYRSYSTAFYDLAEDRGIALFGAIRPGCLINLIPASGVLLLPEASSGCTCPHPLRCSLVLKRKHKRSQPWTVFITHGAMTPAKHFAINLGAPSDMRDDEGTLWFGYPNPDTAPPYLDSRNHYPNYGVKFDLRDEVLRGMGYYCSDFKGITVEGSDRPWLFTSGCLGLLRFEVPLIDDMWGEEPGVYTVRLGFNALSNDRLGQRVFDIMLQGDCVLKNFDILKEAGAPNKAVLKELKRIKVKNVLTVELVSKETNPTLAQAPMINFIEAIREGGANISVARLHIRPIKRSDAETLLRAAKDELSKKNYEKALEMYHTVLEAAPSVNLKQQALEKMAAIGSPKSLSRLAKYCRDISPILWGYKEPDPELMNSATKVFVAIANNTAKRDKQKAVKMLKHALTIANSDISKDVVVSLKNLGVNINDNAGK